MDIGDPGDFQVFFKFFEFVVHGLIPSWGYYTIRDRLFQYKNTNIFIIVQKKRKKG